MTRKNYETTFKKREKIGVNRNGNMNDDNEIAYICMYVCL